MRCQDTRPCPTSLLSQPFLSFFLLISPKSTLSLSLCFSRCLPIDTQHLETSLKCKQKCYAALERNYLQQEKKLRNVIDRDRLSSNRQPSNSLPSVERLPHFLGSNFGSNQLDFGFQFRLRFLVQVRVRPNCSHNMRDVTAFVSPLSNCPPLQEIIPPRHRLSFPLPSRQNLTFWIFSTLEFHFLIKS